MGSVAEQAPDFGVGLVQHLASTPAAAGSAAGHSLAPGTAGMLRSGATRSARAGIGCPAV